MIYIHRGKIFRNIKENSYKGFNFSINHGFNIETDVHFIKNNIPVCFHDFDLKRINKVNKKIKNLNENDLKKFKIIKLVRLIKLLKKKTRLLVEIKPFFNKKNIYKFYNIVKKNKKNIRLISFKEKNLQKLRNLDKNIKLGLVFNGNKNLNFIKSKLKQKHINFFVLYKNRLGNKKIDVLNIEKIYYTFKKVDLKKIPKSKNLIIEDILT